MEAAVELLDDGWYRPRPSYSYGDGQTILVTTVTDDNWAKLQSQTAEVGHAYGRTLQLRNGNHVYFTPGGESHSYSWMPGEPNEGRSAQEFLRDNYERIDEPYNVYGYVVPSRYAATLIHIYEEAGWPDITVETSKCVMGYLGEVGYHLDAMPDSYGTGWDYHNISWFDRLRELYEEGPPGSLNTPVAVAHTFTTLDEAKHKLRAQIISVGKTRNWCGPDTNTWLQKFDLLPLGEEDEMLAEYVGKVHSEITEFAALQGASGYKGDLVLGPWLANEDEIGSQPSAHMITVADAEARVAEARRGVVQAEDVRSTLIGLYDGGDGPLSFDELNSALNDLSLEAYSEDWRAEVVLQITVEGASAEDDVRSAIEDALTVSNDRYSSYSVDIESVDTIRNIERQ